MARRGSVPSIWVAFVLLRSACGAQATVSMRSSLAESGWFKVSHGYIVAFNRRSQKLRGRDSLEVLDREGRRVVTLDVLGQLPGVVELALADVSISPADRVLVVAATVRRMDGGVQSMLLYFTPDGLLERGLDIPPGREINRIDLDEDGNVWTLTDYFGRGDDTTGPLIFVYDHTGHLIKSLLRRTDYSAGFREDPRKGGVVGFGLTDNGVWFWQPSCHRMTVVSREGRVIRQMSVALPKPRADRLHANPPQAVVVALLPSGRVGAGIVSPLPDVPAGAYLSKGSHFVRTSSQSLWPIGVDGLNFVFLKQGEHGSDRFEVSWEPIGQ